MCAARGQVAVVVIVGIISGAILVNAGKRAYLLKKGVWFFKSIGCRAPIIVLNNSDRRIPSPRLVNCIEVAQGVRPFVRSGS